MSTIAARLGGSKGTLYNYFKSKEELFEAYIRETCGRMGGVYGNFFNFYLCDLTLKTFGLQPGGPVRDVRLTVQPSGRCTPR